MIMLILFCYNGLGVLVFDWITVPTFEARIKISVSADISVIGFYGYIGYIGDISVDIFT